MYRIFQVFFLSNREDHRFLWSVIFGISFSIAVILSTMGIMNGFTKTMQDGLRKSNGDISIMSRHGFFRYTEPEMKKKLQNLFETFHFVGISSVVQTESFFIANSTNTQGVVVRGVDANYDFVTGIKMNLDSLVIGEKLAEKYSLKKGDSVTMLFGKGNGAMKSKPLFLNFKISDIINHGIYVKDLRQVYMKISTLQEIIGVGEKANLILIKTNIDNSNEKIEQIVSDLNKSFEATFFARPFWREFSTLLEAVKTEKFMIGLILQLVVLVSVFNVLALIMYIREQKSSEFFLFGALGASTYSLSKMWVYFIHGIWAIACALSIFLVELFSWILSHASFLKLPAEIYFMPRIHMVLHFTDYLLVFMMAWAWVVFVTFFILKKMKKQSILTGLRQEFT